MIIREGYNTKVAAPGITNTAEAFEKYKLFIDNPAATMDAFLEFITVPSEDRDVFLAEATEENQVNGVIYIDRQLTV
jgi:hypothetical protein